MYIVVLCKPTDLVSEAFFSNCAQTLGNVQLCDQEMETQTVLHSVNGVEEPSTYPWTLQSRQPIPIVHETLGRPTVSSRRQLLS